MSCRFLFGITTLTYLDNVIIIGTLCVSDKTTYPYSIFTLGRMDVLT